VGCGLKCKPAGEVVDLIIERDEGEDLFCHSQEEKEVKRVEKSGSQSYSVRRRSV